MNDSADRPKEPASLVGAIAGAMRPSQWIKNVFVLVPLLFAGPTLREQGLFGASLWLRVLAGMGVFCLASSATYILNDISDIDADRAHPVKRNRPIASGALPVRKAYQSCAVLLLLALAGAGAVGNTFSACIVLYLLQNVAYSRILKHVAWVDTAMIAFGFVLRIVAGGEAAGVPLSHWLLATTGLLALFLALGKRKHEQLTTDAQHRSALTGYHPVALTAALWLSAALAGAAYAGYALDPQTAARFHTSALPITIPLPILGLSRFAWLINRPGAAHSPTERMLRDPWFLGIAGCGGALILAVVYGWIGQ